MLFWLKKRGLRSTLLADTQVRTGWQPWLDTARDMKTLWSSATEPAWLIHLAHATRVPERQVVGAGIAAVDLWLEASGLPSPLPAAEWAKFRTPARRRLEALLTAMAQLEAGARAGSAGALPSDLDLTGRTLCLAFFSMLAALVHHEQQTSPAALYVAVSRALDAFSSLASPELRARLTATVRTGLTR